MNSVQRPPQLPYSIISKVLMDEDFFFIQIGSNDGKTGDPIYEYVVKYGWRGILIEPVPYLYEKLKSTYAGRTGLVFENIAIADEDGYKTFYRVEENDEPGNPFWYDQLGSFCKEVVLKHRHIVPNLEKHLVSEQIPCISLDSLLQKHGVSKLNLLNIDTEGYDYEIIKTVPFGRIKPYVILYEHKHLSGHDKQACASLLTEQGYHILEIQGDTFAYL